jgi:plastocyanin
MTRRVCSSMASLVAIAVLITMVGSGSVGESSSIPAAQEQRIDIVIRNYEFILTQPAPLRVGMPTAIILRNQDIVRHGFTSPMLPQLNLRVEGEGSTAYGKGMEGFYVDPGKTLVIYLTTERTGSYTFRCDLHPQMKGELFALEIPTA